MQKSIRLILGFMITWQLFGCGQKAAARKEAEQNIPVRVSKVQLRDLNEIIEYAGDIKAQDEVMVYPKVSGKIIEKVKEEGAAVKKGEAIAYIDRDEVGLKFEKAPVDSPLDGVVGRVYVDLGQNVGRDTPVALVLNPDKMKIALDIPEKYLSKISLGDEAKITVDSYQGEVLVGKVTRISPVVNLENRAAPIEITLDNQGRELRSGMFARVTLVVEKHSAVPVVMKESIIGKEPNTYIYLIENNKAVLKKIMVGAHQGPYYQVKEGVQEGDSAVIMGQGRLHDNAQVLVEEDNSQGDLQ